LSVTLGLIVSASVETCRTSESAALRDELRKARRLQKTALKALEARTLELNDALEQQSAMAATLKTLSQSAFDLDAVLNSLIESALPLCKASTGLLVVRFAGEIRLKHTDPWPVAFEKLVEEKVKTPDQSILFCRVLLSGEVKMITDTQSDPDYASRGHTINRSLLGVPLLRDGDTIGAFVLGKAEPGGFSERHVELLKTFADQAVIAIGTVRVFNDLAKRTAELDLSLRDLRITQDRLLKSEKLASRAERLRSLGQMVTGIAHEINTPLGVAITAASHIEDETKRVIEDYEHHRLSDAVLYEHLMSASEASRLLMGNLTRAGDLVASFKRVSVDEVSGDLRRFRLNDVLQDAAAMTRPRLRELKHELSVECSEDLVLTSYPATYAQILTNFVMNSAMHAFPDGRAGALSLSAQQIENYLELSYSDNGVGVEPGILGRIFEYFFTTRRGQGGSGLGLGIVHNLVTHQLGGQIEATSEPGKGLSFRILIPLSLSTSHDEERSG
jgi:signal transduction histidine kinase